MRAWNAKTKAETRISAKIVRANPPNPIPMEQTAYDNVNLDTVISLNSNNTRINLSFI